MQMGMAIGGLDGEDADLLRRAMGSKRGVERIESLKKKLYAGMAAHGIVGDAADAIYVQIEAFANFGFAESHSLSFALLVYASTWLKLHYPGAFLAGLLQAQPMGFYSPASLVADARRHGVRVLRPDLHRSGVHPRLEPTDGAETDGAETEGAGMASCLGEQPPIGPFDPDAPDVSAAHRRDSAFRVRLGLAGVKGIGTSLAERIVAERDEHGRYASMNELVRRVGVTTAQLEALATAGAFACLGLHRREAIWLAGAAATDRSEFLAGSTIAVQPPLFPDPTGRERLIADLWATGVSCDDHPLTHFRAMLDSRGVLTSRELRTHETGRRIEVAGLVTHRQRPLTASGITFMNVEDEFGQANIVCSTGVWRRYRRIALDAPALIVRGIVERSAEGVVNVVADAFCDLRVEGIPHRSRDFR